jgi:hypothetical protein
MADVGSFSRRSYNCYPYKGADHTRLIMAGTDACLRRMSSAGRFGSIVAGCTNLL